MQQGLHHFGGSSQQQQQQQQQHEQQHFHQQAAQQVEYEQYYSQQLQEQAAQQQVEYEQYYSQQQGALGGQFGSGYGDGADGSTLYDGQYEVGYGEEVADGFGVYDEGRGAEYGSAGVGGVDLEYEDGHVDEYEVDEYEEGGEGSEEGSLQQQQQQQAAGTVLSKKLIFKGRFEDGQAAENGSAELGLACK
jgi:hypothetical protein